MRVLKFGGSSVANATAMSGVLDIVSEKIKGTDIILVSSAISGCTDELIGISGDASSGKDNSGRMDGLKKRHLDIIRRLFTGVERVEAASECESVFAEMRTALDAGMGVEGFQTFGEILATKILARKLSCDGISCEWLDSRDLIVKGDFERTAELVQKKLAAVGKRSVLVAPGFVARDADGRITNLGRGGSDFSASIYAAAAGAELVEIWTDVPGIMTTNPKVAPSARTIETISYEAAFDMARLGAKVLYAPTVEPARKAGIDINIKDTFLPSHPGTTIGKCGGDGWKGVTDISCADGSFVCLVGEGKLDCDAAGKRIRRALAEATLSADGDIITEGDAILKIPVKANAVKAVVRAVHHEFFEEAGLAEIGVYIAGNGAVGKALKEAILSGAERFARRGRKIVLKGISSERTFVDEVIATAPRRSVFVDCTDSFEIWKKYEALFDAGISVVSSNRRSLAVSFSDYAAMKQAALRGNCRFRYDTTVGAALPILDSIVSTDEITSIEAVVSCTLNYIISSYDGALSDSFATLLRHAQDEGLTESDPRIDLGGRDALRKLLILAREAGIPLEEDDVEITPMLGPGYFNCDLDEFYRKLTEAEPRFIEREKELDEMGMRQRFVASVKRLPGGNGFKAEIKMQLVGPDSPFYWISGTENVTVIRSRYSQPLVIKGAGEGARLAASGIIHDILE